DAAAGHAGSGAGRRRSADIARGCRSDPAVLCDGYGITLAASHSWVHSDGMRAGRGVGDVIDRAIPAGARIYQRYAVAYGPVAVGNGGECLPAASERDQDGDEVP